MQRRRPADVMIALTVMLLVSSCGKVQSSAEKAAEDARAVAMVEAAQDVKSPPQPIEPDQITAADIESNRLYGTGCTLVPVNMPGGNPVVIANGQRAFVKLAGKFVTFAADPGSPEIGLGVRAHYVGKAQSLALVRGSGRGTALGQDGMRWDGRVEIRDAADRVIWSSAGDLTCGQ